MRPALALIALIVLPAVAVAQTTWYVDDDNVSGPWHGSQQFPFQYIQDGIDAALDGDTVLAADGTYKGDGNRDIDFLGKTITVRSQNGAANTVVDCEGSASDPHRGFRFHGGEEPLSVLDGFMSMPPAGCGGGIQCLEDCSPSISNCVIRNCTAEICGGGMIAYYSRPRIVNCTFAENTATEENITGGSGGGLSVYFHGNPEVIGCTFIGNNAEILGGGIAVNMMGKSLISGCLLRNNRAAKGGGVSSGGIVTNENCSPVIENCTIKGNCDALSGGGIACMCPAFLQSGGSPVIRNNVISGNTANGGGGVYLYGGGFIAESNVITGNSARSGGAIEAVVFSNGIGEIRNCAITGNTALVDGWPGPGNIDSDPLLDDPANGDFHLTWLSPCINRGMNDGAPQLDIDGDARPHMGTCDMGPDEFTGGHALGADAFSLPAGTGGTITFYLFGGAPNGGRGYLVLGSLSGTAPGFPLPGGATLLLNLDLFTQLVHRYVNTPVFQSFRGNLSWGSSTASAVLDTRGPRPAAAGMTVHFAFALDGPWDFASNPVAIEMLP